MARAGSDRCAAAMAAAEPRPVARMERSAIRERRCSLSIVPGLRFAPSGLRRLEAEMRPFVVAMPLRIRVVPTPRKAKPKSVAKTPPLKKGGGAPRGAPPGRIEKRCGARPYSFPSLLRGARPRTSLSLGPHGAGALAFRRPTAASEVFDLGSAQAALPGTTGCKREDPLRHQCSEHLAVRHAPDGTMPKPPASAVYRCAHENRSRSALRSTLAKGVPLRAGFWLGNRNGDESQGRCLFIRDRLVGAD
jgi:hypothetical protein